MISIPLVLTSPRPCSYLDEQKSQSVFVHPSFTLNNATYSQLIQQGFRRSGDEVYVPHCPHCTACVSARIPVQQFKANRSQQRCWRKNSQTKVVIKPAVFVQTHYDLYLRYQNSRHTDGDMAKATPADYIDFLGCSWGDTVFVEFLIDDELAGVAIVDQLDNALSAVYTFFDPKFSSQSLGAYAVLWQIEQAKSQGKEFLYLGFWIQACQKMAYKSNYQPLQLLHDKQWQDYTDVVKR